jgi:hypothetical protein
MNISAETAIIGAGLAGLVSALELLQKGRNVTIIDAQPRPAIGGLARSAFGGMALVGTPDQTNKGIIDSPEIALKDWLSFAEFGQQDEWPKAWAKYYVENSLEHVYHYLKSIDVTFMPAVNWVERGLEIPGNSVPRYHIIWGCSLRLVEQLVARLLPYEGKQLSFYFNNKVTELTLQNNRLVGFEGYSTINSDDVFSCTAENTIVACGGFTGNIEKVKKNWPVAWGAAPEIILNGSHISNDGVLHDAVDNIGGNLTHMSDMWNYAAGIPDPQATFPGKGLSLIPCKNALWLDAFGKRIGPPPLLTGFDTHQMCHQLSQQQHPWSWQILNWRIAAKEFAVSGASHNGMIRDRRMLMLLKQIIFGNHALVKQMKNESEEFIVANNIEQLVNKMNQITPEICLDPKQLKQTVADYDALIEQGEKNWDDDQLTRIMEMRKWPTDKLRTCYPKPILKDPRLIAIKVNIISRKSLGGIQTNLNSQVLTTDGATIPGLYAVGEAAGFGGGGASGKRSLEGTFLAGCILTAKQAAAAL